MTDQGPVATETPSLTLKDRWKNFVEKVPTLTVVHVIAISSVTGLALNFWDRLKAKKRHV